MTSFSLAAAARSSGPINSLSDRCRLRQGALSRALVDAGCVGKLTLNLFEYEHDLANYVIPPKVICLISLTETFVVIHLFPFN